jgi:hypothetical protein
LRRCADFLREGFRGEALAYAATKPPLVNLVSDLQFRELPDWERVCTQLGLARPTRLSPETAASLIEADRQMEPLKELLAKHRYLALARAGLPARLEVLRQLIAADPQNPVWKRDADELVQARMATLRTDAMAAIRTGDAVAVDKILAELNAGMTAAPADLKDALTQASAALRESTAIAELRALLPRVREASAAMSYDPCRKVLAQWGKIVKESRLNVPADLRAEILPMARWLDESDDQRGRQREFRDACDMLRHALQNDAPLEQLTLLYRKALGFEIELPEDLLANYRRVTEIAKREANKEQRKQFMFAAALVGVIVIGLLVLGYVMIGMGKH